MTELSVSSHTWRTVTSFSYWRIKGINQTEHGHQREMNLKGDYCLLCDLVHVINFSQSFLIYSIGDDDGLLGVLACLGCYSKISQTRWLKEQKFIFSQSLRLESVRSWL